jgi:hypothetical protein
LGLALLLCGIALAGPSGNPAAHGSDNEIKTQKNGEAGNQPIPGFSLQSAVKSAPTSKSKTIPNQHDGESLPRWPDYVLACAAGGQLIFAGLLWLSTNRLWISTDRLAEGAEKALLADQRPWVSIEIEPASDLVIQENSYWCLTPKIIIKNHGKLPASEVQYRFAFCKNAQDAIDIQEEMIVVMGRIINVGQIIFPRKKFIKIDQITDWIISEKNPLGFKLRGATDSNVKFICGVVTYKFLDSFGTTRFCVLVAKSVPSHHIIVGVGYGIEQQETFVATGEQIFHKWGSGNSAI